MDDFKNKKKRGSQDNQRKNVANLCNSDDNLNTDAHEVLQLKEQFCISLDSIRPNINIQLNKIEEDFNIAILRSILVVWLEFRFLDTEVDGSNPGISMLCP